MKPWGNSSVDGENIWRWKNLTFSTGFPPHFPLAHDEADSGSKCSSKESCSTDKKHNKTRIPPVASEKKSEENVPLTWLERLEFHDFRIFSRTSLHPSPGVNILCGANAQGKTTVLEGIALLSSGRLMRGSKDAQAIRHGQDLARVEGQLGVTGSELAVELKSAGRKRVELNGMSLGRASDLIGRMPVVSFSAADLSIVTGEPSDRRLFLDSELAQLFPAYLKNLTIYKRALEHRNALLRQAQEQFVPEEVFEPWDDQISNSGTALRKARAEWVTRLRGHAASAHSSLGAGEPLDVSYSIRDEGDDVGSLRQALSQNRRMEVARGSTCFGPHRDDLAITIMGTEARYFGSQGQQRTAVIAIKLGVLQEAQDVMGMPPILLLDDVFSDLDTSRRSRLMELTLSCGGQVFLTCTEASQAGEGLVESSQCFWVESGQVRAK